VPFVDQIEARKLASFRPDLRVVRGKGNRASRSLVECSWDRTDRERRSNACSVSSTSRWRSFIVTAWRASRLDRGFAGRASGLGSRDVAAVGSDLALGQGLNRPVQRGARVARAIRWSANDRDRPPVPAWKAACVFRGGFDVAPEVRWAFAVNDRGLAHPRSPFCGPPSQQSRYAEPRAAGRAEHNCRGSGPLQTGKVISRCCCRSRLPRRACRWPSRTSPRREIRSTCGG
jgi:hypothetical protein